MGGQPYKLLTAPKNLVQKYVILYIATEKLNKNLHVEADTDKSAKLFTCTTRMYPS